jgi:hypothetical protein
VELTFVASVESRLGTRLLHRAEFVRHIARLANITLVFIPLGCPDRWKPLDRRVFGILKKAYAREMWWKHSHKSEAVSALA